MFSVVCNTTISKLTADRAVQPVRVAFSPSPLSCPSPMDRQDEQSSPPDRSATPRPSSDPSTDNEPTESPANPTTDDDPSKESLVEEQSVWLTADEQQVILDGLGMSHRDVIRTGLFQVEPRPITDPEAKGVINVAIHTVLEHLPSLEMELVADRPVFVAMAMSFGLGCRTMWTMSKEMDSRTSQRLLEV